MAAPFPQDRAAILMTPLEDAMEIFLFVIDGRPGMRLSLHEAQACLEENLRDQRDVSDIWWDDESPYEARRYLYGSSHTDTALDDEAEVDFETTDQIIWPVILEVDNPGKPLGPLEFGGVEMIMEVRTRTEKHQIIEAVTESVWSESRIRPHVVSHFAAWAGMALADHWIKKERT